MSVDLTEFTAKGFPGGWDHWLIETAVAGIDAEQSRSMVRLCPETEAVLYGPEFSPTVIQYCRGKRPGLERIVATLTGQTPRQRVEAAMAWVRTGIKHAHLHGPLAPDRGFTEEQLIASGTGWCNEQARVFIALCEVMKVPARLCFLFHANAVCGHTAAEVYLDGRWAFFDVTFGLRMELPGGKLAEGRELSGPHRELAHRAYREPLTTHYERCLPFVENGPGWNRAERPAIERGGDLLDTLGICNYLIPGVQAVSG